MFAGVWLVIGIEDLADRFRGNLLIDRAEIIAGVEGLEIKGFDSLGLPETQQVCCCNSISGYRGIIRSPFDGKFGNPAHPETVLLVIIRLGAAAEIYIVSDLGARDLPGVTGAKPFISHFNLLSVPDLLIKGAEFIADPVPDCRNLERCK